MTHTDTTRALLARIFAAPDDDTARLVYADALDECAGKWCPECKGTGWEPGREGHEYCGECMGNPPPDGNAARAELVRLQVELARREGTQQEREECSWGASCACRSHELTRRVRTLLAAHRAEWQHVECPTCKGDCVLLLGTETMMRCGHCAGTGDATRRAGVVVEWERGFPAAVRCRLADVWERYTVPCPTCNRVRAPLECPTCEDAGDVEMWRITPWALAIARAHPVTRWELVDRVPWRVHSNGMWWWVDAEREGPVDGVPDSCQVPREVLLKMPEANCSPSNRRAEFKTPELARDALTTALGALVREEADRE